MHRLRWSLGIDRYQLRKKIVIKQEDRSNRNFVLTPIESPTPFSNIRIQNFDRKLLHYMNGAWFSKEHNCFESSDHLAVKLNTTSNQIRQSRYRLKKAGLIQSKQTKSDRSRGTISILTLTPFGKEYLQWSFENKGNSSGIAVGSVDTGDKEQKSDKLSIEKSIEITAAKKRPKYRYSKEDYRLSRLFSKNIQRSLPIKGTPVWSEKCAEVLRQLREIDGYSVQEIEQTLNYIIQDNDVSRFCLAKNIRSCSTLRTKWKNELTKFATAYNEMMEWKRANPDPNDPDSMPDSLREYNGTVRKVYDHPLDRDENLNGRGRAYSHKIVKVYDDLMNLPLPNWKINSKKFLEFEQLAYDISMFFDELIFERKWSDYLCIAFFEVLQKDNKNLHFFTSDILREKIKVFFLERVDKYFSTLPDKFAQKRFTQWTDHSCQPPKRREEEAIRIWWDENWKQRVLDFLEDQIDNDPFRRSPIYYEDEEVQVDIDGCCVHAKGQAGDDWFPTIISAPKTYKKPRFDGKWKIGDQDDFDEFSDVYERRRK